MKKNSRNPAKEDLGEFLDIASEVIVSPHGVMQELTGYSFVIGKSPSEERTNRDPPSEMSKDREIIPIDEYLGLYEPNKMKITIFNKGLRRASEILGCNIEHLGMIVRCHEWAHAIIHVGVTDDERLQASQSDEGWQKILHKHTEIYAGIDDRLHEVFAQLLTYYALQGKEERCTRQVSKNTLDRIIKLFFNLNKHQPTEYRINNLTEISRDRFMKSIDLVKRGNLRLSYGAWETITTW